MKQRAFTLIELLVVISIIALLASVVLASLNSARDKGRLGAGKYFAAQVDHIASDQAIGIWDLDDCSGSMAVDRSGNNNNGTLNGTPLPSWSTTDTPLGRGCSLSFNGTNQYVGIPNTPGLNITSSITLAAWVKLNTYVSGGTNTDRANILIQASSYYLSVNSSTGTLDASFSGITPSGHISSVSQVPLNKWVFVVVTYNGSNIKWYVDGKLDKTLSGSGSITGLNYQAQIGGEIGYGRFTNGLIDSARIFSKDLSAREVGRLYAIGLPAHPLVLK